MRSFNKTLRRDMALEKKILQRDKERLRKHPEGYLTCSGNSFYRVLNDGTKQYLSVKQSRLIRALAAKGFLSRRVAMIQNNLEWQEKLLQRYQPYDNDTILGSLNKACRSGLFFGQAAAQAEGSEFYGSSTRDEVEKNPVLFGRTAIQQTADGDFRRSKSETIISNLLNQYGISYAYEQPLHWPDRMPADKLELKQLMQLPDHLLPDFTLTLPSGRIVYWEHLGMLKSPDYLEKFKKKLLFYHLLGINPGDNLIITCDTYDGALDSQKVAEIIEQLLS